MRRLESGKTPRGYLLEQFDDTFLVYLPEGGIQSATPQQTFNVDGLEDIQSATPTPDVALVKDDNSFKNNDVAAVADEKVS